MDKLCLVIGRGPNVHVNLDDDNGVSRIHALVVETHGARIELRDLASSSGTFIFRRGEKRNVARPPESGRAILSVGETFFIGQYRIEVCFAGLPEEEPTLKREDFDEEDTNVEKMEK
ncbi:MAG: FHA domain-containing protein [Deltaproteobacteria bacterium]|nr:FHA domain-containing protein [Deltaproteobacteria bacterium]